MAPKTTLLEKTVAIHIRLKKTCCTSQVFLMNISEISRNNQYSAENYRNRKMWNILVMIDFRCVQTFMTANIAKHALEKIRS